MSLAEMTKNELLAVAEQFGTDAKPSMKKDDILALLAEDGSWQALITGLINGGVAPGVNPNSFDNAALVVNSAGQYSVNFGYGNNQSGFCAEIPAETLKVGTEQDDVPTQVLVNQLKIRRDAGQRCGALCLKRGEARHPIILPLKQ